MAKRKRGSKRTANAKQASQGAITDAQWQIVLERQEQASQRAIKLVLDAFSKAGITFDPNKEIDAQWRLFLKTRYDMWAERASQPVPPRLLVQDKNSRLVTERLLSKLTELRSGVLLLEQEAKRADIPAMKQNVALRVREELYQLQTIWKIQPDWDHDHSRWIETFIRMIEDLTWSAAHALEVGIHASHGKSNTLFEYTAFVRGLYDFWTAKKSQIGVYKSGGRYIGPFVELVERCEELLPADLRPPSADARGKRVARAIGVHKKAKTS